MSPQPVSAAVAVEAAHEEGALPAGRIWVSSRELDDAAEWDGEGDPGAAEDGEFELAGGHADEIAGGVAGRIQAEEAAPDATPKFDDRSELVPVAASVFDDEFFRNPRPGRRAAEEGIPAPAVNERANWNSMREPELALTETAAVDTGIYAGATASHESPDELDIPAFLRRGR